MNLGKEVTYVPNLHHTDEPYLIDAGYTGDADWDLDLGIYDQCVHRLGLEIYTLIRQRFTQTRKTFTQSG